MKQEMRHLPRRSVARLAASGLVATALIVTPLAAQAAPHEDAAAKPPHASTTKPKPPKPSRPSEPAPTTTTTTTKPVPTTTTTSKPAPTTTTTTTSAPAPTTTTSSNPSHPVPQPSEAPTEPVTIDVVTANGSGCKPGTTAVALSPDKQAMTMTYSEYTAQIGPNVKADQFRKACQLALDLKVPSGFTYGVVKADYRGYAQIPEGAVGTNKASYYYQGMSETGKVQSEIKGPHDGDFIFTDEVPFADVVWNPCGERRYLNIKTEMKLNRGTAAENAEGTMSQDSADVSVKTTYRFVWKKCPA